MKTKPKVKTATKATKPRSAEARRSLERMARPLALTSARRQAVYNAIAEEVMRTRIAISKIAPNEEVDFLLFKLGNAAPEAAFIAFARRKEKRYSEGRSTGSGAYGSTNIHE